jgi:hypothetical protein
MALIMPEERTFDRDPTEGQFPSGTYPMELSRVSEVGPSAKYPDSGPRLVFEFTHPDGPYQGKKAAQFVGKKLWVNPKLNKESGLVKLARQLGCPDPMKGFDPDAYVGKRFNVTCELTGSGEEARAWVRFVTPAEQPEKSDYKGIDFAKLAASMEARKAGGPPPRRKPADKPAPAFYWVETNPDADPIQVKDLRAWFAEDDKRDAHKVLVCPEGGQEFKPAVEFEPALLF